MLIMEILCTWRKKFLKASWFGKMVLECVFRKINDFAVIKLSTTQLFQKYVETCHFSL